MRFFSTLVLLPALVKAFAPVPVHRGMGVRLLPPLTNKVTDVADDIVERSENALDKVDDIVINRAMRFVDHAPVLATLFYYGKQAASTKFGIDAAPDVFASAVATPALLAVPSWVYYVWPVISIIQLASVAKSALDDDGNELSQGDISALAVSNICAAKALTSSNPLIYLALTSIVSAAPLRGASNNDVTLHNAAFQIMSSFTAVASILVGTAMLPQWLPFFDGKAELTATIGVGLYYFLAYRDANTTVKKSVNAGVIGAIIWNRLATAGIALTKGSLLSVSLLSAVYVAYVAFDSLRKDVTSDD